MEEKKRNLYISNVSKQLLLSGMFIVFSLFVETVTFLVLGFNALPEYLLIDIFILLIITGVIFLIPAFKIQQVFFAFFIVIQVIISFANVTLYDIFGMIATIDMVNLLGDAAQAIEISVIDLNLMFLFIGLILAYIFANIIFNKKVKTVKIKMRSDKIKLAIFILIGFLVVQFTGLYGLEEQIKSLNTISAFNYIGNDEFLYNELLFKTESLKKFGTYGFYFRDINTSLFNLKNNDEERINEASAYLENGSLSSTNTYTGISEGNNVIVIMAESFEWYAVDEELTPTLYALNQNNVSMTNYYSKSKTNISEATGFLGSYPLAQTFTSILPGAAKLIENNYSYSLPNLLKIEGYEGMNYFINHEKTFYDRISTYENFGFNNIYDISDFSVIPDSSINYWGDWPLDSEFFKGAIEEIAPTGLEAPFFNWITTMVMHGPYEGNYRLQKYIDIIKDSNWENPLAGTPKEDYLLNYVAATMDFDRAMEYLLEELEARNLLETTTLVMFADHETFYHDLGTTVKGINKSQYQNPEIYRVPFLIYDDNLPTMEITDFSCSYDIMPTILDLLGISYNTNMYMGNSILDDTKNTEVFLSLTGGIFNEKMFTENGINIVTNDDNITKEEKEKFLQDAEELIYKLLKINDLYNYDLFY